MDCPKQTLPYAIKVSNDTMKGERKCRVATSSELYIKISSKSGSEITIESFHEREKPEDLIEENWI